MLSPKTVSESASGKIVSTVLPLARNSSTCAESCMPHSIGCLVRPPNGESTSTRLVSDGQVRVFVNSPVSPSMYRAVTQAVRLAPLGGTRGDRVHQGDSAGTIEHHWLARAGIDSSDENGRWTGQLSLGSREEAVIARQFDRTHHRRMPRPVRALPLPSGAACRPHPKQRR